MSNGPPPPSTTDSLLRSILAQLARGGGRRLAPWEEITYFQTPVWTVTGVSPGNPFTQLVAGNPNRVVLVISASGACVLTTDPTISTSGGLNLTQTNPYIAFREKDDGPLPSLAWYAATMGGVNVTTAEVILRQWPAGSG